MCAASKDGKKAGETARERTLRLLSRGVGPSLTHTLKRLKEGMDAVQVRAHYDSKTGQWVYSVPLTDNTTRLKAVQQALVLHDALPAERHELDASDDLKDLGERLRNAIEAKRKRDKKKAG